MIIRKRYIAVNKSLGEDSVIVIYSFLKTGICNTMSHPLHLTVKKYINKRYLLIVGEWLKKNGMIPIYSDLISLFLLCLKTRHTAFFQYYHIP
jgi:hypothetical protein